MLILLNIWSMRKAVVQLLPNVSNSITQSVRQIPVYTVLNGCCACPPTGRRVAKQEHSYRSSPNTCQESRLAEPLGMNNVGTVAQEHVRHDPPTPLRC